MEVPMRLWYCMRNFKYSISSRKAIPHFKNVTKCENKWQNEMLQRQSTITVTNLVRGNLCDYRFINWQLSKAPAESREKSSITKMETANYGSMGKYCRENSNRIPPLARVYLLGNVVHLWGIWKVVHLWWSCNQWSLSWNTWVRNRRPFGSHSWEQNDNADETQKTKNAFEKHGGCPDCINVRFNRARTSLLLPSSLSFVSERLSNWGAYETCSRFPRKTNSSNFFFANL